MCGILAAYSRNKPILPATFERMLARLTLRGPDGGGCWYGAAPAVALGHRRLAIIDLSSNGAQPMANETGDIRLVHNGEIYNFRELRVALEELGHRFRSQSDSEVIIHAYEEWGDESLQRLRGIFAFALWDGRRRRMLLARDQIGVKPLYYWEHAEGVIAASEAKAILEHPEFRRQLNLPALQNYLAYRYVPSGESTYVELATLPPATYLVVDAAGCRQHRFWSLRYQPEITDVDEAIERVAAGFAESIRVQSVSDVPVGVLLSGGIDSSAVLARLTAEKECALPCFTTGFAEQEFDERPYARAAADVYGALKDELLMTREILMATLAEYIDWHDEPFFDYSGVPIFLMAQRARARGIKVLFAGDGGDELFAGYLRYEKVATWARGNGARLAALLGQKTEALRRKYFSMVGYLDATQQRRLLRAAGPFDHLAVMRDRFSGDLPPVVAAQLFDFGTYLVDDILTKVDRASMAAGVEVRVPLLDHRLVELAFKIDLRVNFADGDRKWVFKRAIASWMPPELLTNRKKGFGFPMDAWLDRPWRDGAAQILAGGSLVEKGILAQNAAMKLLHAGSGEQCWLLLCAELWARRWLDQQEVREVLARVGLAGRVAV